MGPKLHSWVLFLVNMFMYVLIFVFITIAYMEECLTRDYLVGSFIFSLILVTLANALLKRITFAKCPKCGSKCTISGRNPVYYTCVSCAFSQKSNLFEGGSKNDHSRD